MQRIKTQNTVVKTPRPFLFANVCISLRCHTRRIIFLFVNDGIQSHCAMRRKACRDRANRINAAAVSPFLELALMFVRFDHIASGIVNADHSIM